jgi:hypothetical protein
MSREKTFELALAENKAKAPAARKQRREKQKLKRPWRALEHEWHEQMKHTFGKDFVSSKWSDKIEGKLARALLAEVELDTAVAMVKRCITEWDKKKPGAPSFRYFWAMRDSLRSIENGQTKSRRERVDADEYSEARDGHLPRIGW